MEETHGPIIWNAVRDLEFAYFCRQLLSNAWYCYPDCCEILQQLEYNNNINNIYNNY